MAAFFPISWASVLVRQNSCHSEPSRADLCWTKLYIGRPPKGIFDPSPLDLERVEGCCFRSAGQLPGSAKRGIPGGTR